MNDVSGNYVKNDVDLAMNLLMFGIKKIPENGENYEEHVIMRSTLTLLEMLNRNVSKQMKNNSK